MSKLEELIQRYCPDGVVWSTIGDVCQKVFAGGTPTSSNSSYYGGDIPWLRSGEVNFNEITSTEKTITEEGYNSSSARWVEKQSVLVAMTGATVARSAITMIELTANQSVCALVPKREILNYRFLYYWISKSYLQMKGMAQGALTSLNLNLIKSIEIPVPPLPVQEEIVRVLDTFTELQAELQAELQKRLQQYNYYRDNLLSFEGRKDVQWKKLGALCPLITKQTGFDYSNHIKDNLVREKEADCLPYIQTKFFTGRVFDFNTDYYIPEAVAAKFPKIVLDTKCILFSIVGASIGNIGLYDTPIKSFLGGAIGVAKPHSNVNVEYLYYYLTSHDGQKQIFHKVKGAGQATVTIEDIREFLIPLPSITEQQKIVDILDRFDALTTDLSLGLPAEIEKRRQQYEYYRDKLLTFKRKEA